MSLVDFNFAGLDKIYILPLFLVVIYLILRNYFYYKKRVILIFDPKNKYSVLKNFSLKKYLIKKIFLISALILIFIAILQPQYGKKEFNVTQEGRDLLILLDVSKSMLAKDFSPSRLEFTKLKIKNLLSKLTFERVGLILFSGSAFVQCPLTSDKAAFLMFLDSVDVSTIASGTTAIDNALLQAINVYKNSNRKNKLVALFTDGEDFSLNLESTKNFAAQQEIKLFVIGVASEQGAPIPIIDQYGNQKSHEVDSSGKIVFSKLNEQVLQQISKDLSGCYIRATYDESDINKLLNLVKNYEKEKFEDKKLSYYQDQYPWFLGIAWILLALEWVL